MADVELAHLIKMINQIADNIAIGEEADVACEKLLIHIQRFWARSMKQRIIQYANTGGGELRPMARDAISQLQDQSTNAAS